LIPPAARSFREIYIDTFRYIELSSAIASPFYAFYFLFRFNYNCWGRVINRIREEDRRIRGISDTTIGHAEDIKKSLGLVQRFGSRGWKGADHPFALVRQRELLEDFEHLIEQTNLLWQEREKVAAIRRRRSEDRWTLLTNAFTFVYVHPDRSSADGSAPPVTCPPRNLERVPAKYPQVRPHHRHQRRLRHERHRNQRRHPGYLAAFCRRRRRQHHRAALAGRRELDPGNG
jgi:hypothetical protein